MSIKELLTLNDAAHRLGGGATISFEGVPMHTDQLTGELLMAVRAELQTHHFAGQKITVEMISFAIAVGVKKGLELVLAKAADLEADRLANRSLDALEAQQSLEASKAGSHRG